MLKGFGSGKSFTLMKRLIVYFLVIILLMFSLSLYSIHRFNTFYSSFYELLLDSINTQRISTELDGLYNQIDKYTHSGDKKYILNYQQNADNIISLVNDLKAASDKNLDNYYTYRDTKAMLITFEDYGSKIIGDYDSGMGQIYVNQSVTKLSQLKGNIQDEINDLLLVRLKIVQNYYSGFWAKMETGESLVFVITVFITLLCIFFAFTFSRRISVPIHQLVLKLKKVAAGDLEVDVQKPGGNDEIGILVDSFNLTVTRIRGLIERIREKADVEGQLKEQEIKNLEITNLLNRSELNYLQSQINPHFLFNTLNSIAALADIEEASRTKQMIENVSCILRYNLKKINEQVTLREELDIVRSYLYIQGIRYGSRIEFVLNIDERVLDCSIPSMIIQPFVENAIMHGLEPKLGNGRLELSVRKTDESIVITIFDDGVGMACEKLDSIRNRDVKPDSKRGIGVINVMHRLEIYYNYDAVSIESTPGKGTTVSIRLPVKESSSL